MLKTELEQENDATYITGVGKLWSADYIRQATGLFVAYKEI